MVIVSDTSVISNFLQINQLELLRLLFHQIVILSKVATELNSLASFDFDLDWLTTSDWIEIRRVSNPDLVQPLLSLVDEGEAEAIILTKEKQSGILSR